MSPAYTFGERWPFLDLPIEFPAGCEVSRMLLHEQRRSGWFIIDLLDASAQDPVADVSVEGDRHAVGITGAIDGTWATRMEPAAGDWF